MLPTNVKKSSSSLVVREMQIKTTMRYHLTPIGIEVIKKSGVNRCWRACGETGTLLHHWWKCKKKIRRHAGETGEMGMLLHCWWACKLVQSLWKTVWQFLKALEIESPFDPAIPLLGIYPTDYKSFYYKEYEHECSLQHCLQ